MSEIKRFYQQINQAKESFKHLRTAADSQMTTIQSIHQDLNLTQKAFNILTQQLEGEANKLHAIQIPYFQGVRVYFQSD